MRWLSLIEALDHICRTQKCTQTEAQRQLKAKIGDETIPVKWADSVGNNDIPDPQYLRGTVFILLDQGFAHDEESTYRPLMVLRSAVLTTWLNSSRTSTRPPLKEAESIKYYVPGNKKKNDRLRWMTLVEAVEHIQVSQNCNSLEALRQLKNEIGDGMVSVKWAGRVATPADKPDPGFLRTSQMILTGPGLAIDRKQLRPLLVFCPDILRLWPEENDQINRIPVERLNSKSGPGRPSVRELIRNTLSEMRDEKLLPRNGNQKKIATEAAKRLNRQIGGPGWSMRTVIQHISDWQKENPPAHQKTR